MSKIRYQKLEDQLIAAALTGLIVHSAHSSDQHIGERAIYLAKATIKKLKELEKAEKGPAKQTSESKPRA